MPVHYEVTGRTALVTIDRPEARNAVDEEVAEGLERAVDRVEADPEVWIAVLCGAPPAFSAGADLKAIAARGVAATVTERGGFAGFVRRERTKPFIAAVEGPAVAGGFEIVLACDLVVASVDAVFGIPEVKRSLIAAGGGVLRLGWKLPPNVAMECALTGDPLTAEAAHRYGLVNELTEPGAAVEAAFALAERVCANAPVAVRESRRLVAAADPADPDGWRAMEEGLGRIVGSEDYREGLEAFAEKRPPSWRGR
jgi:enoyl-CoA hydratase